MTGQGDGQGEADITKTDDADAKICGHAFRTISSFGKTVH
jgi:hypothetical protein